MNNLTILTAYCPITMTFSIFPHSAHSDTLHKNIPVTLLLQLFLLTSILRKNVTISSPDKTELFFPTFASNSTLDDSFSIPPSLTPYDSLMLVFSPYILQYKKRIWEVIFAVVL